jgi:hypothetical protein
MRWYPLSIAIPLIIKIHQNYGSPNLFLASWVSAGNRVLRLLIFLLPLYIILTLVESKGGQKWDSLDTFITPDLNVYIGLFLAVVGTYVLFSIYLYKFRYTVQASIIEAELVENLVVKINKKSIRKMFMAAFAVEIDLILFVVLAFVQGYYMPEMILTNLLFLFLFFGVSQLLIGRFKESQVARDTLGIIIYVCILLVFAIIAIMKALPVTTIVVIFFMQRLMTMTMIRLEKNHLKIIELVK